MSNAKKILLGLTALFLFSGVVPAAIMKPLAWEKDHPKRDRWSRHVFEQIYRNFDILDRAHDMDLFCPNYYNLNHDERVNVWGQLIAAMSWFESGWNKKARFPEPRLGIDPVTNRTVHSEGLLQLGYADAMWRSYCDFDWTQDIQFEDDDIRKTIFDPYLNLTCGIGILTSQIKKYERIIIKQGAYWAVIKKDHRNQKINGIRKIITQWDMCKIK